MSPHSIILCALLALLPLASWAGQTPEEVKKDVATIRLKAELGNADAQFNLGACYSCGLSVLPKDEAEAVKWYRKAAEQGHVGAQYNLGNCYSYGLGVPKDEAEAVKWYRKAAEQGHAMSQGYITSWAGMTPKEVQTFDDARLKAGKGDADAQYMLGMCYSDGKGVPKDKAEAVKWFRKAALQGNAEAQLTLGMRYSKGDGVLKDEVEAYAWIYLSAHTNVGAQWLLGILQTGLSGSDLAAREKRTNELLEMVAKNKRAVSTTEVKQFNDYKIAAEQGHAEAQFLIGLMYFRGRGVPKDQVEAVKWYRKAAEQGDAEAQCRLGFCYANGEGVLKDEVESDKWYRKAAEQREKERQALIEKNKAAAGTK